MVTPFTISSQTSWSCVTKTTEAGRSDTQKKNTLHQPGLPQTQEHQSRWSKRGTGRRAAGRGRPAPLHTEQSCATLLKKKKRDKVGGLKGYIQPLNHINDHLSNSEVAQTGGERSASEMEEDHPRLERLSSQPVFH